MAATSKSDMLESRRRAYLDALGIPLYHPRQQLPGALPSARLSSVPPARAAEVAAPASAALSPAPPRPADGPVPGPSRAAAQETVQRVPLQGAAMETSPSRAAQAVLAQSPTTTASRAEDPDDAPAEVGESSSAQEEAVAFTFAFVPVSEQIAVINELPTAGAPALTPGSRQLLARILTALTLPVQERNLSSQSFVWPSPDLPVTEQGAAPARELLKGFLARRFRIRPVRYLLVLAEQGAPYLFPAGFAISEGQLFQHPDFDVQVLVTRSLEAMEAVPALKRDVWSALQPLLGALSGQDGAQGQQSRDSRHDS